MHKLTVKQKEQLSQVKPSTDKLMEYKPCQVVLSNGTKLDNVYIQEIQTYLKYWGVLPGSDPRYKHIMIEDDSEILESPNRLPAEFANIVYKAGESGMGYCIFQIVFDDENTIDVVVGNAVDFVPLPKGYKKEEIKDVLPHKGSRINPKHGLEYYWCLYESD